MRSRSFHSGNKPDDARVLFSRIAGTCSAVNITDLRVPATHIVNGDPLMLDCVYELAPDETKLVVKWLLNEQQVYQWIPGSRPYSLNVMRNRIDEKHEASPEPEKAHRALVIAKPTWNMSGEYTCVVDSFQSSARKSSILQIVVPPEELSIREKKEAETENEEEAEVTCEADDAYPEPQLSLQFRNGESLINQVLNQSTCLCFSMILFKVESL